MILFFLFIVVLSLLIAVVYLLGFQLGAASGWNRLREVQEPATQARWQVNELTQAAFRAMADEAVRRRQR